MAKQGVTGSAIKELKVREWESEHRLRAEVNLFKMKKLEETWVCVSVFTHKNGCVITKYKPLNNKRQKANLTVVVKTSGNNE